MRMPLAVAFMLAASIHSRNGGEFDGPGYAEADFIAAIDLDTPPPGWRGKRKGKK